MKVLIDACVLYPTFLRDLVLSYAETGAFQPLWSERILEEWRRAAARNGPKDAAIAEAEIAMLKARHPGAMVVASEETQDRIVLRDQDDIHVLAAAVDGGAEALLTLNTKDFPLRVLGAENIERRHPDEFLLEGVHTDGPAMQALVNGVFERARAHGIDVSNKRALLKRAKVPRLAKAITHL